MYFDHYFLCIEQDVNFARQSGSNLIKTSKYVKLIFKKFSKQDGKVIPIKLISYKKLIAFSKIIAPRFSRRPVLQNLGRLFSTQQQTDRDPRANIYSLKDNGRGNDHLTKFVIGGREGGVNDVS